MPSMRRPSKLKADTMATRAKSVTNNHVWRIMAVSGAREQGEGPQMWRERRAGVDRCAAADAFHGQRCECSGRTAGRGRLCGRRAAGVAVAVGQRRSEEHTSELQSHV